MRKETGNVPRDKRIFRKKDDGVSSVVGEMLLLAIGVILVAVFAASLTGLLPGDRDDHVDVAMKPDVPDGPDASNGKILFYHKGGDAIAKDELRVLVYPENSVNPRACSISSLKDSNDDPTEIFNLGCVLEVSAPNMASNDQVRLMTDNTIIYTGVVKGVVKNETEA